MNARPEITNLLGEDTGSELPDIGLGDDFSDRSYKALHELLLGTHLLLFIPLLKHAVHTFVSGCLQWRYLLPPNVLMVCSPISLKSLLENSLS